MKIKILIILFSVLLVFSCEKEKYENTGTVTAQDMTLCACCGGYFIEIDGSQYRFEKGNLPGNFTFEDSEIPFEVELDWELKTAYCPNFKWIDVSKIRKK